MSTLRDYYQIIDDIRQYKNVTVEELCDGVISERTYYRYMLSGNGMKYDVFDKLAKRLGVKAYDLIHYSVFVHRGDPGLTKFIYRMEIGYDKDIETMYHTVLSYRSKSREMQLLLELYIKRYEVRTSRCSKQDYNNYLESTIEDLKDNSLTKDSVASFLTLYLEEYPNTDKVDVNALVEHYIKADFTIAVEFKMYAYNRLLTLGIEHDIMTLDQFQRLTDKMSQLMPFYNHKFFTCRNDLFHAFIGLRGNDTEKMNHYLYRHIMGLVVQRDKTHQQPHFELVRRIFGVDPLEFVRTRAPQTINKHPFKLVTD